MVALLGGCAVNPVTGEKELSLVSEAQELSIGKQEYAPLRQAQGGDYIADREIAAYVSQVGQRLAAVSDRKLPYEFQVINNSTPNAWALPGGKIAINRGLLTELESEAELAAVLGHEITHAAAKHTVQNISRNMLLQGAVLATVVVTRDSDYAQLAQLGAGLGAQLINQKYGRDAEREADYYGMKYMSLTGYNTQGAVELQKTFVKLSEGRRQDWLSGLFASHPPSQERVQNNLQTLAKYPAGGEDGRRNFKARLAHLKKTEPAYEAHDKGRKALADGDLALARQLALKARKLEPREGHFEALLGDIEQKRDNHRAALKHYGKAIRLNDGFFYYHLQQGIANEQLGNRQQAKQDLERSITLLPTANAYHSLGNIARQERRYPEAKEYYAKAAQDKTAIGKQAYASLVELDLSDNPGKYLRVQAGVDKRGRALARVHNATPKPVTGIVLGAEYTDAAGRTRSRKIRLRGVLQPGKTATVDLELDNLDKAAQRSLRAGVIQASLAR
ncbi:MAG: M48 family metalloprotease [Gammaproteobacteria bacterium]|nr:MAG: M48 family metalloprotease [Gammaproteobacteria bacterium]